MKKSPFPQVLLAIMLLAFIPLHPYSQNTRTVTAQSGTADFLGGGLPWHEIVFLVDSSLRHKWECGNEGFDAGLTFAIFDTICGGFATGSIWTSKFSDVAPAHPCNGYQWNQVYGNIHCEFSDLYGFDFPTSNSCFMDSIVSFVSSIPDGYFVLAYSVNAANYNSWHQDLINTFTSLGSTLMDSLTTFSNAPWAFFAKKGFPNTAVEQMGSSITDTVILSATFVCTDTTTGINSFPAENVLIIQNPIHNALILEYTLKQDELLSVDLYDTGGKLVKRLMSNESRSKGTYKESLNIGKDLIPGYYILTLTNGLQSMSINLMKQ